MKTRIFLGPLLAVALLMVPAGVAAQTPIASLSVGSGSGLPGATGISIPVSLQSQDGALVAGLSFDLTFDSSRLAYVSASLGSAAASAGKTLPPPTQPAPDRIRVIIYGGQTVILDGAVLVVTFNVMAGADPGISFLTLSGAVAASPSGTSVPVDTDNGSFDVLAPPATNTPTATATATHTITPTQTPTATSGGPTNTTTPTATQTLTPIPGAPTDTAAPTSTAGPTKTRTPTPTRTAVGTLTAQTSTPVGASTASPTGTVATMLTGTPGSNEDPGAAQTAEAATAAAEFEAAVAGTATALAEFDAAVRATATALAGGNPGPTPESGGIMPRPGWSVVLLLGSGALALIALAAIIAFIFVRRRERA